MGALVRDCWMNISLEMSDGWIKILLLRSRRLSSVGLLVVLKIILFPFLGFWLINLQNLVIAFLAHVHECLVMGARACFWVFLPMFPSSVTHSSIEGSIEGGGIEVWG